LATALKKLESGIEIVSVGVDTVSFMLKTIDFYAGVALRLSKERAEPNPLSYRFSFCNALDRCETAFTDWFFPSRQTAQMAVLRR